MRDIISEHPKTPAEHTNTATKSHPYINWQREWIASIDKNYNNEYTQTPKLYTKQTTENSNSYNSLKRTKNHDQNSCTPPKNKVRKIGHSVINKTSLGTENTP